MGSDAGTGRRGDAASLYRTAYEVTESIPVGTYTMVLPPGGGMGRFSFMSTRFLELTGLDRETAAADPFRAFACVHPDDHDEWVRKNAEVFAAKTPFFGECRIIVRGEVRWITAESSPRDLPDGSTVWEGVLIDVTDRKRAEAALVSANRNMQLAADAAGLGFWEYDVTAGNSRRSCGPASPPRRSPTRSISLWRRSCCRPRRRGSRDSRPRRSAWWPGRPSAWSPRSTA